MATATVNRLPQEDQAQTFLGMIEKNARNCGRILGVPDKDDDTIRTVIRSLESLERQVERVAGRLLSKEQALSMLEPLKALTAEARSQIGRERVSTSYAAPREETRALILDGQVDLLVEEHCTATEMADALTVSERTIYRRLSDRGISLREKYCSLSDAELDKVVEEVLHMNQNIGAQAVIGRLRDRGIKVQRQRVRDSVLRVDPVGVAMRTLKPKLERGVYVVAAPNSLWHIDGNHKLIRYGIVIHGAIDGYSRLITSLKASTNNKATTVLENFTVAINTYGTPSRIRVDQGVENADICLVMSLLRGFDRSSAVRGPSVHNQRIERVWVDAWNGATHLFYKLFAFFEAEGFLVIGDSLDVWVLQEVYLPEINRELQLFQGQWNHHGLSSEHGRSPRKLFLLGMLKNYNSDLVAVRDFFDRGGIPAQRTETEEVTQEMMRAALGKARVEVPQVCPPLNQAQQEAVRQHVQGMSSDRFAVDKYLAGRAFARQLLNPAHLSSN